MLAQSPEAPVRFTRRDAGRLIAASAVLVIAMSVILGLDILPAQTQLEVDKPAPSNVFAPRARRHVPRSATSTTSRPPRQRPSRSSRPRHSSGPSGWSMRRSPTA